MLQYYEARSIPKEIALPVLLEEQEDLQVALLEGHPEATSVAVRHPTRGARRDLIEMANKNASYRLEENDRLQQGKKIALEVLRDKLKLARLPVRMECIDISNIQGMAIVASDVCFIDGRPSKEHYRHYIIRNVEGGPDDFASMREAVRRRIERGNRDNDLPDLLVIDGGKGQLSAAMDAVKQFGKVDMEVISLAKSRVQKGRRRDFTKDSNPERSFERVFFPHREVPVPLAPGTSEYRLLTQIRDEAHRFAITHHRKRRSKLAHGSDIEEVPGIGPAMRKTLLKAFGGLEGIKQASLEELRAIKGLREASAVALYSRLQNAADAQEQPPIEMGQIQHQVDSGDQPHGAIPDSPVR